MARTTERHETDGQGEMGRALAAVDEGLPPSKKAIVITPPHFRLLHVRVVGTAPYMQARFSEKSFQQMRAKQEAGETAKKGRKREPRDFLADYERAMHLTAKQEHGIPAAAFRNAAIDACRMAGFVMTRAKMSLFVLADALDKVDGTPLVLLHSKAGPSQSEMPAPNDNGSMDIRVRPMWDDWWVELVVRYDADQFTAADVTNLLLRAGVQVGVGEGRPFSRNSNGLGFGTFTVEGGEDEDDGAVSL
jgi:hypothetical protein